MMQTRRAAPFRSTVVAVLATLLVSACVSPGAAPTASPSPTPISVETAVQLVLDQEPFFAGISARDANLIGQSAWYEVIREPDGYRVTVRIGWGDCPAGCINEHVWEYRVSASGEVELVTETGPSLQPDAIPSPVAT